MVEPDVDEKLWRLEGSEGDERSHANRLSDHGGGEDEADGARVVPALAEQCHAELCWHGDRQHDRPDQGKSS